MTTISQQVLDAVTKALELIALINEARGEVLVAKRAEDEVRLTNRVKEIEEAAAARVKTTEEGAKAAFAATVAEAQKPLQQAQQEFDQKVAVEQGRRDALVQAAQRNCDQTVADARRSQDIRAATAQAEVHQAQQKVASIQATLEQFRRQTREKLGIDLTALTVPQG